MTRKEERKLLLISDNMIAYTEKYTENFEDFIYLEKVHTSGGREGNGERKLPILA